MKSRSAWQRKSVILPLAAAVLLAAAPGCGDGPVRGAGSIDVPRPAKFVTPVRGGARGAKAPSLPRGSS